MGTVRRRGDQRQQFRRVAFTQPARLTARGESLAAFDERCIPKPPQRGCRVRGPGAGGVAPPSNTPGVATPPRKPRAAGAPVLSRRALPAGRGASLVSV